MLTQRNELIRQLQQQGWEAGLIDESEYRWKSSAWRIDELWLLESVWSPKGRQVYLTFLIDPQADLQKRKKGGGVWAVMASAQFPLSQCSQICLSRNSGWEWNLPVFCRKLLLYE